MADLSLRYLLFGEDRSASKTVAGVGKEADGLGTKLSGLGAKLGQAIGGEVGDAVSKFSEGLGEMSDKAKSGAEKLGIAGAAVSGLGVGLQALGSSDAAAKAQLDAAIEATGNSASDYKDEIEQTIKSQENFGHSAADTQQALATLTASTNNPTKAMQVMGVAANLAASKHEALGEAATQVARIMAGTGGKTLATYGITMDDTKSKTAAGTEALTELSAKLSGQAAASVDSFNGHLDVLKTKIEDGASAFANTYGPAITATGAGLTGFAAVLEIVKARQEASAAAAAEDTIATDAQSVATKLAAAAQWLLNTAMDANPFVLIAVAVAAFVAGIVLAYQHVGWFRDLVNSAFGEVKRVSLDVFDAVATAISGPFDWAQAHWPLLLAILTGPIGAAVLVITSNWGTIKTGITDVKNWVATEITNIVGFFTGIPGRIGSAVGAMGTAGRNLMSSFWNAMTGAVGDVGDIAGEFAGAIARGLDRILGLPIKVPKISVAGVSVGGETLIPAIPFAAGGIVTSPTFAMIGEAGPEAVIPLSRAAGLGGGGDVHFHIAGSVVTEKDIARVVTSHQDVWRRRNGIGSVLQGA